MMNMNLKNDKLLFIKKTAVIIGVAFCVLCTNTSTSLAASDSEKNFTQTVLMKKKKKHFRFERMEHYVNSRAQVKALEKSGWGGIKKRLSIASSRSLDIAYNMSGRGFRSLNLKDLDNSINRGVIPITRDVIDKSENEIEENVVTEELYIDAADTIETAASEGENLNSYTPDTELFETVSDEGINEDVQETAEDVSKEAEVNEASVENEQVNNDNNQTNDSESTDDNEKSEEIVSEETTQDNNASVDENTDGTVSDGEQAEGTNEVIENEVKPKKETPETSNEQSVSEDKAKEEESSKDEVNTSETEDNELNISDGSSASEIEKKIFKKINKYRKSLGLNKLKWSDTAYEMAKIRAVESGINWSHTRPDGRDCYSITSDFGIYNRYFGENLSRGTTDPALIVEMWKNSPTHNKIMTDPNYKYGAVALSGDCSALEVLN